MEGRGGGEGGQIIRALPEEELPPREARWGIGDGWEKGGGTEEGQCSPGTKYSSWESENSGRDRRHRTRSETDNPHNSTCWGGRRRMGADQQEGGGAVGTH